MCTFNKRISNIYIKRLPDGISPHFITKPNTQQTQDSLTIQLELEANPTPTMSWYLNDKDLNEADSRYSTKIEKTGSDKYLLTLVVKVGQLFFYIYCFRYFAV